MQIDLELDISLDIHHQRRKDKIASPFSRVHKEKKGGGGGGESSLLLSPCVERIDLTGD